MVGSPLEANMTPVQAHSHINKDLMVTRMKLRVFPSLS